MSSPSFIERPFIERYGLRTPDEARAADELIRRLEAEKIDLVRLVWSDAHGYSRAKLLTRAAVVGAIRNGYNIGVATTTLDGAGARTFSSFTRGGGMGLAEMTGSPNLTVLPDPATFRVLPWTPGIGWILCDEYFTSGVPFHFSPRMLLKRQLARLAERGLSLKVGLEVEWYLLRLAADHLTAENTGSPGFRGKPIATVPVEPGFHFHSETNLDLMQPVLSALASTYAAIGLDLRSIEKEWGPGQVECTFAPADALKAADELLLFRTATRQVSRRMGHFATFMARPAIKGFYSSGWHLHQSLVDRATGRNVLIPERADPPLSPIGMQWLGGLIAHAVPGAVFTCPTVNGFRRYRPNSLAPDRTTWAVDHRGVMVRVLGAPGDPATRLENRIGEPSANPYLFILSQLVSGLAGLETGADPGPQDLEPYAADRTPLPKSLGEALTRLSKSKLYRSALGDTFIDYYVALKRTELGRFEQFLIERGLAGPGEEPTEWEQNEYFDFF